MARVEECDRLPIIPQLQPETRRGSARWAPRALLLALLLGSTALLTACPANNPVIDTPTPSSYEVYLPVVIVDNPDATATPEATPTPKPENPLPSYSVFFGNATDEKGAKVAEVVIASIPQQGSPDQIFMYYIGIPISTERRGSSLASQFIPNKVDGTHFERGGFSSPKINLPPRMTADFNQQEMTVTGTDIDICLPGNIPCDTRFTLKCVGTGKQTIFNTMQRAIDNLAPSAQRTTYQKELDFFLPLYKTWP